MGRKKPRKKTGGKPKMKRVRRLSLPDALNIAIRLHRSGQLAEAGEMYDKILEAEPAQPDALHFKGVLAHQMGRSEEAVTLIRQALVHVPEHLDAWNNLGNVYKESGSADQAAEAYHRVLAIQPDHPDANCNLAVLHRGSGRLTDAMAHLRRALTASPEHVDALYNLSLLLHDAGEYDKAAQAARRALELGRDLPGTYENVASSLRKAGRMNEAVEALRRWIRRDPDNPVAAHMLSAYVGDSTPERASDAYVTQTFDEFAPSFDTVLERLQYRAPQLVADALDAAAGEAVRLEQILDAGCGTGLCGLLVRPRAGKLTGVDLSSKMIVRARERSVYDELVVAELTDYLADSPGRFNAVVCADTLVYFGRLEAVMSAARKSLSAGGLFIFTVEDKATDDGESFRLEPTGRYSHARGYINDTVTGAGLELRAVSEAVLRKETGRPVPGLVVTALRPAG